MKKEKNEEEKKLKKKKKNPYIPVEVESEYTAEGKSENKEEGEMEEEGGRRSNWRKKKGWSELDMVMEKDDEDDNALVIVPKEQWGGVAARWTRKMGPPYEVFHVTDTGTEQCFDRETCLRTLQKLQDYHMTQMNLPDIAWNFLFASDGTVYVGRGWENEGYKPAAVKKEFGKQTIVEFGYIGDFQRGPVTNQIEIASHLFIKRAVQAGKVPKKHIITTIKREKEVW